MLIDVSKLISRDRFGIVTVGHFALDMIISDKIDQPARVLGGPPTYVSAAAAKLGSRVSVISKVGHDFPKRHEKWLESNCVDLSGLERVPEALTTRFTVRYSNSKRELRLKALAPPISSDDINESIRSEIVHIAPIAGEVSSDVVLKLRKVAKILSLDPQGFVRAFDKNGNATLKKWRDLRVLEKIDIFKSTFEESQAITCTHGIKKAMGQLADYGIKVVMITRGMKGSVLYHDRRFQIIPSCKSKNIVDPTGAGDAFAGGFLAEHLKHKDVAWCACVGSAMASFIVEGVGPQRFGERHEVYERANRIYEKVV